MANIIDCDNEEIDLIRSIQLEYNKYDFSIEWLTYNFIDDVYSELDKLSQQLETIKNTIGTYSNKTDEIDNTKEPDIEEMYDEEMIDRIASKLAQTYSNEFWTFDAARARVIQLNNNYDGWSFEEQEKYYDSALGLHGDEKI